MKKLVLLVFLLSFLVFVKVSLAVSFTASVTPTILSPGQLSQLLNFTIQNSGAVNITQLNITLYPGFTFTGTSGTTTTSSYTSSSSAPSWINTSTTGLVGNGATQYFWIYVNVPSITGSTGFNITTLDANAAFSSQNVTIGLSDVIAPAYSSNTTSPSTNSSYSAGQLYWFNVTWTDGLDVSKVLIEQNFTGTLTNVTMSNSSSIYYYNLSDLGAGNYVWRTYANDTNNTFNSTSQIVYNIQKAVNEIQLYLNDSLNTNITSILNAQISITANGTCKQGNCNVSLSKDGSIIDSVKPIPYSTTNTITTIGLHNFTATLSGNNNFTNNSATYYVAIVPSYTESTSSIPLTFSNSTLSIFNITFSSDPGLYSVTLQLNFSGYLANYTMLNLSTTRYYYNLTLPAGTHYWKIFGVYSGYSFPITSASSFTINKAAPTLTLIASPQWSLETVIQTNVSCTSSLSFLAPVLYRNGTSVTNPDVQTFTLGSTYEYLCNNTVNQNYTSSSEKNMLTIKQKISSTNISFVDAATSLQMVQNSIVSTDVKIKNGGTALQDIKLEVTNISKSWYSIDSGTKQIPAGSNATFKVTFTIPADATVDDYMAKFVATGKNDSISRDVKLRILPSVETKLKINDTISLYNLDVKKLENKLEEFKKTSNDTSSIEQKLTELKSTLNATSLSVNSGDFFDAQKKLDFAKSLISQIEQQLEAKQSSQNKSVSVPKNIWIVVIVVFVIVVAVFLGFLFWPTKKGYNESAQQYVFQKKESEGIFSQLKKILEKFKRKKQNNITIEEGQ